MCHTHSIILDNIRVLQKRDSLTTYKQLSDLSNVNENTIKSWFSTKRTHPRLTTLDKLCNALQIVTVDLFIKYSTFEHPYTVPNDSRQLYVYNFEKLCKQNNLLNSSDIFNFFDNELSFEQLFSYRRKNNYRTIPLRSLDIVAKKFKIETYKLLLPKEA